MDTTITTFDLIHFMVGILLWVSITVWIIILLKQNDLLRKNIKLLEDDKSEIHEEMELEQLMRLFFEEHRRSNNNYINTLIGGLNTKNEQEEKANNKEETDMAIRLYESYKINNIHELSAYLENEIIAYNQMYFISPGLAEQDKPRIDQIKKDLQTVNEILNIKDES